MWYGNVNLQISTFTFYKSAVPANIISATCRTILQKFAFSGRQICSFYGQRQHIRPFFKNKRIISGKEISLFEGEKLVNNDSIAERFLMFYALANFVENCQE